MHHNLLQPRVINLIATRPQKIIVALPQAELISDVHAQAEVEHDELTI